MLPGSAKIQEYYIASNNDRRNVRKKQKISIVDG